MIIAMPPELEKSILDAVHSGRFASVDEAITEAARLLIREMHRHPPARFTQTEDAPDPLLGLMRDDADLMDEIVADAYRQRRESVWRDVDL